jgi:ABC-type branched-subunit amino acid transport system substrate-binding protein
MSRTTTALASWLAAAALLGGAVAGCGGKGEDSGESSGAGASGSIKTGPGITDKEISLGLLTDLSGVFAPLAKPIVQATQEYWKEQNAKGGACDRTVKLVVKDHGYDPQKAVVQYRELSDVAALQQLLGSPITAALLPTLKSDSMLSLLAAWPSSLLGNDFIIEIGTTYDVEMINGLGYLMEQGKLKDGDKIGHVYFEGEYGENGLKGSEAFAEEHGMQVVQQKIKATDEDMAGQVSALKRAGVKAIAMTTGPTQLASVAGIGATQGLEVPILGNNPTYDPALLESPAADAVKANSYIVASVSAYNSDQPGPMRAAQAWKKAHPDETPKAAVQFGWAQGQVMNEILNQACENKDLSRKGLVKASRQVSNLDLEGLIAGPLDYKKVGEPSTRAVYMTRPADVPGGLKAEKEVVETEEAKSYEVAAE